MMKKIVLIDDDQVFANNLKARFDQTDEQMIIAGDGESGLAQITKEHPDVVVVDVILPKLLGLSVLEAIRNDNTLKFTPVVLISSFGGETNEKRAIELGANAFIVKSNVTLKQLADMIRGYYPHM